MASLNKVQLMGNLTRHNEMNATPSGVVILNNSIAVNRKYKAKDGTTHEEVDFFDFTMFGAGAQVFGKHTGKGDSVYLEGRMKTERWELPDGEKRSRVKVYIDNFQFLKTKPSTPNEQATEAAAHAPANTDAAPF